jgi:GntR family transcriptional regulator, arabinose operon transcriptional repressor
MTQESGTMARSGDSKYMQIKIDIESKITSGHYTTGDRIPSENELASQYGVSVITSRKALELLVHDGLIHREKGRGSFVKAKPSMRSGDSHQDIVTFILLSYDFSDSSTMQLIKGAYTVLTEKKKSMIVEYSKDQPDREAAILDKCIMDRSAGVLLFSTDPEKNIDRLAALNAENIPFVLVDRGITQFPVNIVSCYNLDGAYRIAKHLLQTGHERILFIGNNSPILTEKLRYQGLEMALRERGLEHDARWTIHDFSRHPLVFLEIVAEHHPTAIMCVNDLVACKVTEILRENKISVPQDISVTGFDDADIAKYNLPRLTTVRQDFFEIGRRAAELLMERIDNRHGSCTQLYLPVELVIRESTAPRDNNGHGGSQNC